MTDWSTVQSASCPQCDGFTLFFNPARSEFACIVCEDVEAIQAGGTAPCYVCETSTVNLAWMKDRQVPCHPVCHQEWKARHPRDLESAG